MFLYMNKHDHNEVPRISQKTIGLLRAHRNLTRIECLIVIENSSAGPVYPVCEFGAKGLLYRYNIYRI